MAIDNFIPEVWASDIIVNWREAVVLAPTFSNYSQYARTGNKIHITAVAPPTISDYSATRTITPEALTDAGLVLNVDQEKAFSFYVDDIDAAQAAGSFSPVTADAVAALAEDFETAAAAAMLAGAGTIDHTAVADGDAAYSLVLSMRRKLSQVKAPLGDRFLAVDPLFAEILLGADSKLSQFDTSGTAAGLRQAIIGQLLGFTVVETSLLGDGSHATAVAYHRSAVGYAADLQKVESLRAIDRFDDIVRGLHVYGVDVVRNPGILAWTAS